MNCAVLGGGSWGTALAMQLARCGHPTKMWHFRDGRAVDTHGWIIAAGNNMGCENSCHGDNLGTSYELVPVKNRR